MMPGHVIDLLRHCNVERHDFERMPAFLRSLLVTDGTVTTVLEAWFGEPVAVSVHEQSTILLDEAEMTLGARHGERVLRRHVALTGAGSSRLFAHASSLLRLDALPAGLRHDLVEGRLGIGELLRQRGVETCREIIRITLPPVAIANPVAERTYLIHMNVTPVICVTERFPVEVYL